MKLNLIERIVGSGLFSGYIPFASGTFGSFAAILIYLIPGFSNPTVLLFAISLFSAVGINLGSKFEKIYGKDPSQFTLDEFVGTWISVLFIPKSLLFIGITFFIWRALDIIKPFPARNFEKINGGWGIMLDDIVSGFYTLLVMQILIYFIK